MAKAKKKKKRTPANTLSLGDVAKDIEKAYKFIDSRPAHAKQTLTRVLHHLNLLRGVPTENQ